MPKIFVSYRRDDAPDPAGRLYDALALRFGKDQIFMDVDNIPPGADFVSAIENAVGAADIVLAVIGQNWLRSADVGSRTRLASAGDFVRLEIQAALRHHIPIVPVLVRDAAMPAPAELPRPMRAFARHNAVALRHTSWRTDVDRLLESLAHLAQQSPPRWDAQELPPATTAPDASDGAGARDSAVPSPATTAPRAGTVFDAEPGPRTHRPIGRPIAVVGVLALIVTLVTPAWAIHSGMVRTFSVPVLSPLGTSCPAARDVPAIAADLPTRTGTIALVRRNAFNECTANSLYRLTLATGALEPIIAPSATWSWAPSVSLDGQWLAFDSGDPLGQHDIAVVRRDGTGLSILVHGGDRSVNAPWWTPDGRVGFSRSSGGVSEVFAVPLAGGEPVALTSTPQFAGPHIPTWQKTSDRLAFTGEVQTADGDHYRIFIQAQPGESPREISAPDIEAYAPAWSPDGRRLAFQSGPEAGRTGIFTVDAEGTGPQTVVAVPREGWARAPAWSPDGRWIAYVGMTPGEGIGDRNHGDLYVVPAEGGEPSRVTLDGLTYDWRPAWLP
jgi:Tol biopolymer transport system component